MRGSRTLVMAALLGAVLVAPAAASAEAAAQPFVVVFRDSAVSQPAVGGAKIDRFRANQVAGEIAGRAGFSITNVYGSALGGFSASLTTAQRAMVEADPRVASVMPDIPMRLAEEPGDRFYATEYMVSLAEPRVPAGIRRIGATHNDEASINGKDGRVDVDVAVIDSGIDRDHPDLNVVGGYNCTSANRGAWNDGMGHGTHVAGTIGALDNGRGVVGVAPGARLWAVKVLDNTGFGRMSWITCGIDWVTSRRAGSDSSRPLIEVANMSVRGELVLGDDHNCGRTVRDAMHIALCKSVSAGTVYVVAAGNDRSDASGSRPAAYDEGITVSAMTDYDGKAGGAGARPKECLNGYADDTWAGFSNFGRDVDLAAPGVCVLSTWAGNQYAYASGTSMATPHVAGAAALYLAQFPSAKPQQVRMALQYAAHTDWKRWTDPDGAPDLLVWAADFSRPPDFDVSTDAATISASPDETAVVDVAISRTNGHTAPVKLSVAGLPAGMAADPVITNRESGSVSIEVADWTTSGRYTATLVADDGELVRKTSFDLLVDTAPPTGHFEAPAVSRMQQTRSAHVSWTESDKGSGIAGRTLWRQRSDPVSPGVCAGADFYDVGIARTVKDDYTDSLYDGYCYRWTVTLRDKAGNRTTLISGTVLVDTTAPTRPTAHVVSSSSSVVPAKGITLPSAWVDGSGTVWLRGGGSGSLDLHLAASDGQSGVASFSLSPTTSTTGWSFPRSVGGNTATAHLSYAAKAVALSLTVRATNGAGERGSGASLAFRPDGTAPKPAAWDEPAGGLAYSTDGSVKLAWSGGGDSGSGLASAQYVRRERADITSTGACGSFSLDGSARLMLDGSVESGLHSGYCYRWRLRTTDHVGNLAAAVTSGSVLVDTIDPKVNIDKPVPGSTIVKSTTAQAVAWSASDTGGSKMKSVTVQRQKSTLHQPGSCSGAAWKNDGSARTVASPLKETGLDAGTCYRWQITASDRAGNRISAVTGSVLISGATSTVYAPTSPPTVGTVSVTAGTTALTTSGMVWLDARWTANGGDSTLAGYELRLSSSGGAAWDSYATPNGATPYMALRLPAGRSYAVEVRARNTAGTWSGWSAPSTFSVGLAQAETSSAFETVGTWRSAALSGASAGAVEVSSSSGAIIRYHFSGRSVALIATRGPDRGRADVYVDGYRVATIDLYSPTVALRQVVFTRSWLTSGNHVISLQIHTTGDRPRVDLDAGVVLN